MAKGRAAARRADKESNRAGQNGAGLSVSVVPVASLKPHPRNYRTHPPEQLAHIVRSLEQNGFYRNVVVARDGTILAGHGVVLAAQKMGMDRVPVVRLGLSPTDKRALRVLAGDNEIARGGEMDDRGLTEILRDVMDGEADNLMGTGFDAAQLAALVMVSRNASEIADFDAAAHWVGMPEYDPGKPLHTLTVYFGSKKDRAKFVERSGLDASKVRTFSDGKRWATYWPEKDRPSAEGLKVVR